MFFQNFAVVCIGSPAGLSMTITLSSSNSTPKSRGTSGSTGAGRRSVIISPARTAEDVIAMRELMARERPAWGPWDLKLAPGGLVDIEFCAQHLQIVGAAGGGPLRQNTGEALDALAAMPAEAAARRDPGATLRGRVRRARQAYHL